MNVVFRRHRHPAGRISHESNIIFISVRPCFYSSPEWSNCYREHFVTLFLVPSLCRSVIMSVVVFEMCMLNSLSLSLSSNDIKISWPEFHLHTRGGVLYIYIYI